MKYEFTQQAGRLIKVSLKPVLVLFMAVLLNACASMGPGADDEANVKDEKLSVFLVFSEREEAGTPLFRSRMYVNDKYLYINDDRFPDDFLLFDREKQTIYSVTHSNKTIFVI
jgi:hypothetical protein